MLPADNWSGDLPDPLIAENLDGLIECLRLLKAHAGDMSYSAIVRRVNHTRRQAGHGGNDLTSRSTVAGYFQLGRRRLNEDLMTGIVHALCPDADYVERWRSALRRIRGVTTVRTATLHGHCGLPAEGTSFVGRQTQLHALESLAHRKGQDRVAALHIYGMAGAGKSALALRFATGLVTNGWFRDGQLYADLRRFQPSPESAIAAAVLEEFLRHLEVPAERIPVSLVERTALYRALLHGRQILVVLDNAPEAHSIEPLLPKTDTSLTIITSRSVIASSATVTAFPLRGLTEDEAITLLRQVAGAQRVDTDPDTANTIVHRVGFLPLAITVAGKHLRSNPDWQLTDYLDSLTPLTMAGGVRAALALSDERLPAKPKRLLRLLALHPGMEIDLHVAASLADEPIEVTRHSLNRLAEVQLISPIGNDRFGMHDLVRAYASERAQLDEPANRKRQAVGRVRHHYRQMAANAARILWPHRLPTPPPLAETRWPAPTLSDMDAARAWLATERDTLIDLAISSRDDPAFTVTMAEVLSIDLLHAGRDEARFALHVAARQAARRLGDKRAEACALRDLADCHRISGDLAQSEMYVRHAIAGYREIGERREIVRALWTLADVTRLAGRFDEAHVHYLEALKLARASGNRAAEGGCLVGLGEVDRQRGRLSAASVQLHEALAAFQEAATPSGEAYGMWVLGRIECGTRNFAEAGIRLRRALDLHRHIGNRHGQASALHGLAELALGQGDYHQARDHAEKALTLARKVKDRDTQSDVLNTLAEILNATGDFSRAICRAREASEIAAAMGYPVGTANAKKVSGIALRGIGSHAAAAESWSEAIGLFDQSGLPDAEHVHELLQQPYSGHAS